MNRVNISEQNSHEGLIKLRKESNRAVYQGDITIHSLPYSKKLVDCMNVIRGAQMVERKS